MSWQLASFALVLLALGVAFWWYERSGPPAKLVAVIATLATLAALGRDAFVAVPDFKPITAIVLVSGVAFGAGPGFAVGAISALASNVLLGEGPWTPWQMLGWGLVGLIGGGLGAMTSRRMSPLAIALACALSAAVFNLVLDLYTWTGVGNHTLAAFGVVLGSALAFDLTHIVASFLFALVFGAALLRMLLRVRSRLEVTWDEAEPLPPAGPALPLLPGAVTALVLVSGVCAFAAATVAARASGGSPRQVAYLIHAQNSDGGFGAAHGGSSSELYSAWAAMGLAAAGTDPLSVRHGGHTVLDSIRAQASTVSGAGDLERTILALHAIGVSTRSLAGRDPLAALLRLRARDGSFSELTNLTAFGVLALRAAGYPAANRLVRASARWLTAQQEGDGGFGFADRGSGSDIDDTAAVLQALAAAGGRGEPASNRAAAFLTRVQNLDGGFPQQQRGTSNAQSTAWAVQGLAAAGRNVSTVTRSGSRSPVGYLRSLIAPDGSVRYSRVGAQTPVWVTAQALTALALRPLPISPVASRARAAAPATPVVARAVAVPAVRHASGKHRRPKPRAAVSFASPPAVAAAIGAVAGGTVEPLMRGLSAAL